MTRHLDTGGNTINNLDRTQTSPSLGGVGPFGRIESYVKSKARWWFLVLCLSVVLVSLDYSTAPEFQFPALFILPILLGVS
jgi:hypothetical protein